ncbi:unnamed protein product [Victoria cruziana]
MPSSHGRKKSAAAHGVKSVGCMSGIFYLLQGHRLDQKRITQAAKPDRVLTSNTSQFKELVTTHFSGNAEKQKKISSKQPEPKLPAAAPASDPRRLSCNNVPRSPTLPQEMRRRSSESSGKEKLHRQPGVVARLMGLQDLPDAVVRRPDRQETTSEKRRRILGALEKCEEDLHTLKKIIEAIHVVEKCGRKPVLPVTSPPKAAVEMNHKGGGGCAKGEPCNFLTSSTERSPLHGRRCMEPSSEQPSPVSVLDDSAFSSHDELTPLKNQEESRGAKDIGSSNSFPILKETDKYQRLVADAYAKPCEAASARENSGTPRKTPYMKAIEEEELTEVMKQSARKERLELERIGTILEAHIFCALLEEMVAELRLPRRPVASMASLRCRKRLYY